MASRRRRTRPGPSDEVAAITQHQSDVPVISEATVASDWMGRRLIPVCAGVLLGAAICVAARPIFTASSAGRDPSGEGLLVTQQLESLFDAVESHLQEDASQLESHQELLNTFLMYDRMYVERVGTDPATRLAKAYAAQRMGHCYQIMGRLEDSSESYRTSRDLFAACMQDDPRVVELYCLWLSAHTQIAYVELASGNLHSARNEYRAALRGLQESKLVSGFEYHNSLLPELKALAQLGIELKLYAEAMEIAERYSHSARILADRSPNDPDFTQELADSELCLRILSSALSQHESRQ